MIAFLKQQEWIAIIVERKINLVRRIFIVVITTNLVSVIYMEFPQISIIFFFIHIYLHNKILKTA